MKNWKFNYRVGALTFGLFVLTTTLVTVAILPHNAIRKPTETVGSQQQIEKAVPQNPTESDDPQARIGIRWIKPVGTEAEYAGNEACRSCHPTEFESYSATPHAHSVQPILPGSKRPEFASAQTVSDEEHGIKYSVRNGEGKNRLIASVGAQSAKSVAKWVFGSGTQAWTYMAQTGDKFGQLRVSYYPPSKKWNFTPGSGPGSPFHHALGDPYTPAQAAACFGCHSTVVTGSPEHLDLAHSRLNVGCESCHGPCKSHIDSITGVKLTGSGTPPTHVSIVKPPTHNGQQIMDLCGECHRIPVDVNDEQATPQLARFPGIALRKSRCYIASAGKLSCVSCHDPHMSTHQQQIVSFDRKCISCHTSPQGTACSNGQTQNCVKCHMPAEAIARKLPLVFHNHWIRKDPFVGN